MRLAAAILSAALLALPAPLFALPTLAALKPGILDISRKARKVHVLFNTNYEDQGQVNARLMRQVLV